MPDSISRKMRMQQERKPRIGEKIGGGFIVGCRVGGVGRIILSGVPYEHETLADAKLRAAALALEHPERSYIVLVSADLG